MEAIVEFFSENGHYPTIREMADEFGHTVGAVSAHFELLEIKGQIGNRKSKSRAYSLSPEWEMKALRARLEVVEPDETEG